MFSNIMKFSLMVLILFSALPVFGSEDKFSTETILKQLEEKLQLSSEQLAQLKPVIEAKSVELKKTIAQSIDKGFVQADKLAEQLDAASKASEQKAKQLLNSDEYKKFKDYLTSIDRQAIDETRSQIADELSAALKLTKEQAAKLQPVLEKSAEDLGQMISDIKSVSISSWGEFKKRYEELTDNLRSTLEQTLDSKQMEGLEQYSKEKMDKILEGLFEA